MYSLPCSASAATNNDHRCNTVCTVLYSNVYSSLLRKILPTSPMVLYAMICPCPAWSSQLQVIIIIFQCVDHHRCTVILISRSNSVALLPMRICMAICREDSLRERKIFRSNGVVWCWGEMCVEKSRSHGVKTDEMAMLR
jgi:hypothetical protein